MRFQYIKDENVITKANDIHTRMRAYLFVVPSFIIKIISELNPKIYSSSLAMQSLPMLKRAAKYLFTPKMRDRQ